MKIKNQRWYGDKGARGAVYFDTLDPETGFVPKEQWDQLRFGMACTSVENFAATKAALEELCHDSGECDYINDPIVQNFFSQIEALHAD